MLAAAELGVHAPGRAALVDREGARAGGCRGHEVADLQPQLAGAVEQAADLVGAGALVVGVDLDVEGERLGVERAGDRGVELAGAAVDAAVDVCGGERACDRTGENEVLSAA